MSDKKNVAKKTHYAHKATESYLKIAEEEILAYYEGELSEKERDRFLDRLPFDKDAAQMLLDLESFPAEGEGVEMSENDLEASWNSFKTIAPRNENLSSNGRGTYDFTLVTVAACFLIVSLGMSYWVYTLKNEHQRLSAPTLESDFSDVFLDRQQQRGRPGSGGSTLKLSSRVKTFRLHLSEEWPSYEIYLLDIQDTDGRVIFSGKSESDDENALTLTLVRDFFSGPGPYRLSLSGVEGGRTVLLRRIELEISSP